MSPNPHFSIVTPVFNRESEIRRALGSCFAQSFTDFEVVVADDGSTDRTAEIVARCADPRVRLLRHDRNRGVCPARNPAIRASTGDWVVFLDGDDEVLPGALKRAADLHSHRASLTVSLSSTGTTTAASPPRPCRPSFWLHRMASVHRARSVDGRPLGHKTRLLPRLHAARQRRAGILICARL